MDIAMETYLEAKYHLDQRSFNSEVSAAFLNRLKDRRSLTCLDLGTGTGAAVRRLIGLNLACDLHIVGVDQNASLLKKAAEMTIAALQQGGFETSAHSSAIRARRGHRTVDVEYCMAPMQGWDGIPAGGFDVILAHAVMDLAPIANMVARVQQWLAPAGLFYTTINYDGGTTLFPPFEIMDLEDRILSVYDQSMEARSVSGEATGGARSGRRLFAALTESRLEILAFGSSDWNITPQRGCYRDQDVVCLSALLSMILNEAENSRVFSRSRLEHWHQDRRQCLETGKLGLIIHQIDILAEKTSAIRRLPGLGAQEDDRAHS